jgi:hypothetical protein
MSVRSHFGIFLFLRYSQNFSHISETFDWWWFKMETIEIYGKKREKCQSLIYLKWKFFQWRKDLRPTHKKLTTLTLLVQRSIWQYVIDTPFDLLTWLFNFLFFDSKSLKTLNFWCSQIKKMCQWHILLVHIVLFFIYQINFPYMVI